MPLGFGALTEFALTEVGGAVVVVVIPPFSRQPGGDDAGGFYHAHWRRLQEEQKRLRDRCEENDEECQAILAEVSRVADAVLSTVPVETDAVKLGRIRVALAAAARARQLAEAQQCCDHIYRELMGLNTELIRLRDEEEEEEAIMLLMLH